MMAMGGVQMGNPMRNLARAAALRGGPMPTQPPMMAQQPMGGMGQPQPMGGLGNQLSGPGFGMQPQQQPFRSPVGPSMAPPNNFNPGRGAY